MSTVAINGLGHIVSRIDVYRRGHGYVLFHEEDGEERPQAMLASRS